jgi:hypothetical protein
VASAHGVFQQRQDGKDAMIRSDKLNPHGRGDTMFCQRSLTAMTAGAFTIAALSFPAYAVMQDHSGRIVVAENKPEDKNKPKTNAPKAQPHVIQPRVVQPHVIQHPAGQPNGGQKNFGVQKNVHIQNNNQTQKNIQIQKNIGVQKNGNPKYVNPNNTGGPKNAHRVFTPHGKNSSVVIAAKIRSAPARGAFRTNIRGRNYSVWRSGYRARYHGGWRTFVALSALGAMTIGAYEYYPYAYIDAPQDYCDGLTEDGCQMVYDEVETEEGDAIPQCVAYCPWQ